MDPTGAGDMWRSGFVSGLLEGHDIHKSCQIGNAMASISVENRSAVDFSIRMQELHERIKIIQDNIKFK